MIDLNFGLAGKPQDMSVHPKDIMHIRFGKIALVLLLTIASGLTAVAQETSTPPVKSVALITYSGDFAALLSHMPRTFGVTIGVELDSQRPDSQVLIYVREATLTDVLNAIVKSDPRYRWREIDGGIAVTPVAGSNPLLDITIKRFQVSDVNETEAINQLLGLPEVQSSIKEMNLNLRGPDGASSETKGKNISLSLEGVTMRQALDSIVKENGRFWILRPHGNGTISISNAIKYQ